MRTLTAIEHEVLVKQLASLRPEVAAFALAMEDKLRQNDHKGGWDDCSKQYMAMRLTQEREELRDAIARGAPPEEILKEAADVANFAMMVADLVGGLGAVVVAPGDRPPPIRPASYVETQRIEPKLRWKKLSVAERIALRDEHRGLSEHELSEAHWVPKKTT
jgi:NTP pyrophosphatase (non-canonical NTP hydrolase)